MTYSVWWRDAMTKDYHKEERSKFTQLSECTSNDEIWFVGIEPKYIVCHPGCQQVV